MRRSARTAWTALLLTVAAGGIRVGAVPTTRYISLTGDDANSCATSALPASPKQHLNGASGALACLVSGDTLLMRGGSYNEGIASVTSGVSWANKVRIANYPGETATLRPDPAHSVPGGDVNSVVFLDGDYHYIEFDGINLDGSLLSGNNTTVVVSTNNGNNPHHIRFQNAEVTAGVIGGAAAVLFGGGHSTIFGATGANEAVHLVIHGGGRPGACGVPCASYGVYLSGPNNLVDNCDISDVSGIGIQIYNGSGDDPDNNVVKNNRIHDITRFGGTPGQVWGIIEDGGAGNQIYNNIIYNINVPLSGVGARAGINISHAANALVANNTLYNLSLDMAIVVASSSAAIIQNNVFYLNSGPTVFDYGGNTGLTSNHNVITNPLFANAPAGNFQVQTGSPAIDAGVNLVAVTNDIVGTGRPVNHYTAGAYQFTVATVLPSGTFYVSTTAGLDSRDCATAKDAALPKQTIIAGLNCLNTVGDVLLIKAGNYDETITSDQIPPLVGSSWANAYRVAAYPGDTVMLVPSGGNFAIDLYEAEAYVEFDGINIDASHVLAHAIFIEAWSGGNAHHLRFLNASIAGAPADGISNVMAVNGLGGNEFSHLTIHDVGATDASSGIRLGTPDGLIEACTFYNLKGAGIWLDNSAGFGVTGVVVSNNRIYDGQAGVANQTIGISVGREVSSALLYNNLIYNLIGSRGTPAGILSSGTAAGTQLYNNTIYGVLSGRGIFIADGRGTLVRNNIAYQNSIGNYADSGITTTQDHNVFTLNPLFVNASAGDFRLLAGSPAIDGGQNTVLFTTDLTGMSRLPGTYDAGAYEGAAMAPPSSQILHLRFTR